MRGAKKAFVMLTVLLVGAVSYRIVRSPPPGPAKSLEITIGPALVHKDTTATCSVLLSNVSDCEVQYAGGFGKLWLETAFVTNRSWQYGRVRTPGGGSGVLAPRQVIGETVEIPEGATKLKIGLSVTSLTWRGRTAWHILLHWPEVLRPLCGFLLSQDERKRSTTEWSRDYSIVGDRIVPSQGQNN